MNKNNFINNSDEKEQIIEDRVDNTKSVNKNSSEDVWGDEEIVVEKKKHKKEKSNKKDKKSPKEETKNKEKKHLFKKFFYGVGKEFERVTWTSKKDLALNFLVILVVITFFAIIFTLITLGITNI